MMKESITSSAELVAFLRSNEVQTWRTWRPSPLSELWFVCLVDEPLYNFYERLYNCYLDQTWRGASSESQNDLFVSIADVLGDEEI
jgi:hypothetical protein